MGSKWIKYRLGDIATFSYGKMPKKELIGLGKYVVFSGYKYTDSYPEKNLSVGDLIVVARGVGGTGDVKIANQDCYLTNLSIKIDLDDKIIRKQYFYYQFKQNTLRYLDSGSAQSQITINDLSNIEVVAPLPEVQDSIIEKLRNLDKKIVINTSINQTLEQMSQTLFKSWFVDFDPVIDNALDAGNPIPEALQSRAELRQKVRNSADFKPLPADIRALFPAEFEETELGWVPKGWRIESFSEIAQLVKENVKSEDISTDVHYVGLEHLERKHIFITNYGNGSDVSSNKSAFNKGDLLFGKLRPYFHKVAITPFSGICSTDILVFRAKEKYYKSLMAMYAFTDEFVAYANLRSTGTRMPRAEAKDLLKYKIILPNKNILEKFELLLEGYWTKGQLNNNENEQLTALRDTLLPKLISGELSLEDLPDLVNQTEPA
ncbi:restriction endonuclease subunit S [Klebsiella michiganensis]|uniref:restriction endonuclease subunit S n=1 Tax=Klebsiella michiganensis TaxID=1134687 RepID=UPI001780F781|nr:restriction endonuclease subunit S [Klebsiella michiganensis]ELI8805764.1 restriction endonuclease subunit S [Klebsiella michiganensis]MBE0158736.1 restriction endonuclease subunit S [Klebsiella michiganensis]MBE0168107.1 restriction endonuclease subunit S [Klebsiella michiganensis]MBE0191906.1 restriction endonuclease subunit S [Klebsiella michiganensis]MBE0219295.1 restriction endonuclease subunit S [Klebsiella michiganensis]